MPWASRSSPLKISRTGLLQIDIHTKKYIQSVMPANVNAASAVEEVYRSDWGRIVATLIRLFGDFDLAEEGAQEAFAPAVAQWRVSAVPAFPPPRAIQTWRSKPLAHFSPHPPPSTHTSSSPPSPLPSH